MSDPVFTFTPAEDRAADAQVIAKVSALIADGVPYDQDAHGALATEAIKAVQSWSGTETTDVPGR